VTFATSDDALAFARACAAKQSGVCCYLAKQNAAGRWFVDWLVCQDATGRDISGMFGRAYCEPCLTVNDSDAVYCKKCGSKLGAE